MKDDHSFRAAVGLDVIKKCAAALEAATSDQQAHVTPEVLEAALQLTRACTALNISWQTV